MKIKQNWAEHADLNLANWTNNEEYIWEYEYEDESEEQYLTAANFEEEELYEEEYTYEYTYEYKYTYNYTYVYNYKYSYY
jgi:hypothetical protein